MKTLTTYHRKVLRGILKLSYTSPIAPLYFLLAELPIEATLHLDILALFWNIWANPQTKMFEIMKYILKMSDSTSLTWTAHLRIIFQLYNLPDPLILLSSNLWPKERWKTHTKIAVTSYYEAIWRQKAASNYKLEFLNVQISGLSGKPHPILSWVLTAQDALKIRIHIKMLAGDYLCYAYLARDRNSSPHCRLCQSLTSSPNPVPTEDMVHLLTRCRATTDTRTRILPDLLNIVRQYFPENKLPDSPSHYILTQFILDCTSLNLPQTVRISPSHPDLSQVVKTCSNLCFAVHKERIRQLKKLGHQL